MSQESDRTHPADHPMTTPMSMSIVRALCADLTSHSMLSALRSSYTLCQTCSLGSVNSRRNVNSNHSESFQMQQGCVHVLSYNHTIASKMTLLIGIASLMAVNSRHVRNGGCRARPDAQSIPMLDENSLIGHCPVPSGTAKSVLLLDA